MLLSFGKQENKLPKLQTNKSSTSKQPRQAKALVDDSFVVAQRMQELFSCYDWRVITTEEQFIEYLSARTDLGIDTETTGLDVFHDDLVGFSVGTEEDCAYIPLRHKVGQNYSGDLKRVQKLLDEHLVCHP